MLSRVQTSVLRTTLIIGVQINLALAEKIAQAFVNRPLRGEGVPLTLPILTNTAGNVPGLAAHRASPGITVRVVDQGSKQIVHCISTFKVAESLGFNGHFRACEHLLRIHE